MKPDTLQLAVEEGRAPWTDVEVDTRDFTVFRDKYPVTKGHILVVPKQATQENILKCFNFAVTMGHDNVASDKTTTIVLPGSAVSAFQAMLSLVAGTAANAVSDVAGDTLTLVNSTVANARVSMTCVSDDGTNSKWMTTALSTPIATVS